MDIVRLAIQRPIAVVAAVIMTLMFGLLALQRIPIQLAPDVRRPVVSITTNWHGAAPAEVEREIVNRQEEVLKGMEGVRDLTSRSQDGRARIDLEFSIGENMDRALLLVSNRLNQVTGYPEEADEPAMRTASAEDSPIAWFILSLDEGSDTEMGTYGDFAEDVLRDRIERVPGIARVNVYGGREREMRVIIDPQRMARYRLTVPDVIRSLREADASMTAGDVDEGKRRYVVRSEGTFESLDDVRAVVLRSDLDPQSRRVARVTVADIADVRFDYKEAESRIRVNGRPAIALNAVRETGANVIETMGGVRAAVDELVAGPVSANGLRFDQVYDETVYIDSAIDLVQQNIYVGGVLAALVLLLFLRSARATLVVSLAIPVSVIGTFVAMAAMGRSINVISLAGIAFAVGMVVDAAIVVLENIHRLHENGLSRAQAAHQGAKQVWGAVLVSALTTVMAFIPVLVMELEVGQLFRDIAVAISVSVLLSLVVAITVIPALANRLLADRLSSKGTSARSRLLLVDGVARGATATMLRYTDIVARSKPTAVAVVALVCGAAALVTALFLPKLEYLPEGNRNLIFGIILPPPGYNLETMAEIASGIETATRPYWKTEAGPEPRADGVPKIDRFFFVASRGSTFLGAAAVDPQRAGELIPVFQEPVFREPGTYGFISQPSLFGRGIGGGRIVELDVSGGELNNVLAVARKATGLIEAALPIGEGHQFRPIPGLELGAPEVRFFPDRVRLADNGLSARDLGESVDSFNSGLRVEEITVAGERIDLTLRGPEDHVSRTQGIDALPIVTAEGLILPLASLADVQVTSGPTEIRHRERIRTVTLEVRPAPDMPLETAIDSIRNKVVTPLRAEGLPAGVKLRITGTADKLLETWGAMKINLLVAVAIVYLLMAVLFESFLFPLIIMLSVPLATAGGVIGLLVLNQFFFQALDMLTLLGFVILIGIVVNNAILLVHQTLYLVRQEELPFATALREATRNRLRPIFMSTLTSVFGMLPLVMFPGAGSELYRGLGSVVVGGLFFSAMLTLVIIPPLLSLFSAAAGPTKPRIATAEAVE